MAVSNCLPKSGGEGSVKIGSTVIGSVSELKTSAKAIVIKKEFRQYRF
jgi:hypothetical protein